MQAFERGKYAVVERVEVRENIGSGTPARGSVGRRF